jgi:DNA-binding MarR family transcriptional regulator
VVKPVTDRDLRHLSSQTNDAHLNDRNRISWKFCGARGRRTGDQVMQTHDDGLVTTEAVVESLMRASRALVAVTARSLSSVSAEVTLPQFRTLIVLATRGPQTVTALAENLDVHASTMTRMCTRLVTRGLVVREPSSIDRREVVITLSAAGIELVDNVMRKRRDEFETTVRHLDPAEQRALIHTLDTFARAVGENSTANISMAGPVTSHAFVALEESP